MKRKKIYPIFLVFLFLLLFVIELVIDIKTANSGSKNLNVFSFTSNTTFFTKNEEMILENAGYEFSFTAEAKMIVKSFRNVEEIKIIGTNENFQYLSGKNVLFGAWFNVLQTDRKSKVAVLSEKTALKYFGSTDVVSNELEIDGLKYEVIGVVKGEAGGAGIYIPIDTMEKYHKINTGYSQLWCNLQNKAEISLFLQRLGIEANEVNIFQTEEYWRITHLRLQFIILAIGLCLSVLLFKKMIKSLKIIIAKTEEYLKHHYVKELWELAKQKNYAMLTGKVLLCGGGIICLCKATLFEFILPDLGIIIVKNDIIERVGYILEFYIQPHIWVDDYEYMNQLNVLSLVVFFLIILIGTIIIELRMHRFT